MGRINFGHDPQPAGEKWSDISDCDDCGQMFDKKYGTILLATEMTLCQQCYTREDRLSCDYCGFHICECAHAFHGSGRVVVEDCLDPLAANYDRLIMGDIVSAAAKQAKAFAKDWGLTI